MKSDPSELPWGRIEPGGDVSRRFRDLGFTDLREAVRHVRDLPYGRIESRDDLASVLEEGVGTCSTKHALLARLYRQQGFDGVQLTLGLYEMTERNTPGVGAVLAERGLESLPEAHCYLLYDGDRFDFTGLAAGAEPITRVLEEEPIRPHQIGEYKTGRHRAFLGEWADATGLELTTDELWRIREACIDRLARESDPRVDHRE